MRPRLLSPTLLLISTALAANAATVPLAVNDSVTVRSGTEPTLNVLANDVAGTGPLAVIAASTPAHGKVVLQNGRVRYIPTAGYLGTDSFTYTIRDGLSIGAVDRTALASFGSGASAATVFASGFGSAMARVPGSTTDFYIMTDRGPNSGGTGTNKVFPLPTFAPQIARVTPNGAGGYRVVSIITFKRPTGAPALNVNGTTVSTLTGLPNTFNPTAGIAVTVGGTAIAPANDDFGLDSEGLVALADGSFWVSDEYGPYLAHFSATGVELERVAPSSLNISSLIDHSTHTLPAVLKKRFENKGMEGLTITPDGTKLVGIMQSPLDNLTTGVADVKKGVANRIVVYDLATGVTQQYVYMLERTASGAPNTTVSEIAAITNRKFLIDERDSKFPNDPAGASTFKRIYEIDLDGGPGGTVATDVSDGANNVTDGLSGKMYVGGTKTLEDISYNTTTTLAASALIANGVQPVAKRLVLDLLNLGNGYAYNHDKVEGLAVLSTTTDPVYGTVAANIAISNDDDFGVTDAVPAANTPAQKLTPQGLIDYNEILTIDLTKGGPGVPTSFKHVLMLTIDGFRQVDLADPLLAADLPNILALKTAGITYPNTSCNVPTDSFPGLMGLVTGAGPKTTGIYFDESYSRTLYPAGTTAPGGVPSTTPGARAPWTEAVTFHTAVWNLNGSLTPNVPATGAGWDATVIDPSLLPLLLSGSGASATLSFFYPHQYLNVNTIFEVAKNAGLRTAWSDKHPSYEVLNGPSGSGLSDFFAPESEAKATAVAPADRINGFFTLTDDPAGKKASKSQAVSLGEDDLRVQAVLNQIQGKTSKGVAVAGNTVPALFGMNFIVVNSAQKFDSSVAGGAGISADGLTVSANLHEAFAHTDANIGKIVTALKNTTDVDGRSLYDNTLVVVTSKHGNTPRLGAATVLPTNYFSNVSDLTLAAGPVDAVTGGVKQITEDAVALIWLGNQAQTTAAVTILQGMQTAHPEHILSIDYETSTVHGLTSQGFGDPATDDRTPDIIVKLQPGVIIASSAKRAEHGGFTPEETGVALVLSGGIPTASRGTTQSAAVKTTQVAVSMVNALGLDASKLQGAVTEATTALPGTPTNTVELATATSTATVTASMVGVSNQPYLLPTTSGVLTQAILTAGDSVNLKPDGFTPYRMVGIPDGLGAFDNGDGTFTMLSNHEIGSTLGVARAHGAIGAFVSKWIINKSTLQVLSGADLMQSVNLWNGTAYAPATVAFNRFCSADLPAVSAFNNTASGKGTANRIFMNGEEFSSTTGASGRAVAHVVTGPDAGKSWDLPLFGHMSFENALANPVVQDKTIVMLNDDSGRVGGNPPSEVNVYIGTKTNTGLDIDKAGLTNGLLYGIKVTGKTAEDLVTTAPYGVGAAKGVGVPFTLAQYTTTNLLTDNGLGLQAEAIAKGVTQFSRVEDGAWDPAHPTDYYFVTTDIYDQVKDGVGAQIGRSRLWRLRFTDIANPENGGSIAMMLDGTEAQQMMDNMTIDMQGRILLQEDLGNNAHNGKIWVYNIASGSMTMIAKHNPVLFGDLVGGVTTVGTETADEESTGIIDASAILGTGWYLTADQNHKLSADAELYEGGQFLTLFVPPTSALNTPPTITAIANQAVNLGGSTAALNFTVGDAQTPVGLLTVTVASSNTIVVPLVNVIVAGTGAVRTVTVTAAAGQVGTSTITLTVNDGDGGITNTTFTLTVANAAPTISDVTDQTTNEDTATSAIAVTVSDVDSPVAGLTLTATSSNTTTLVPNASIVVGGSGANRTVTITPAANKNGTSTITLTVTDPQGGTASDTFVLTVTAVNDAPVASNGTAIAGGGATITGTLVATDVDGNPLTFSKVANPTSGTVTVNANGTYTYTANNGPARTDTFTFKANDGTVDSNVATITVTITAGGGGSTGPGDDKKDKKCGLGGGIGVLILSLLLALKGLFVRSRR